MDITLIIQTLLNGILLGGIYALIAAGLNLIVGVLKIINIAHGEFLMLALYFSYWVCVLSGVDPFVALPIIAIAMFIFGLAVYTTLIEPTLKMNLLNQLLVTAALSLILQNLALIAWTADLRSLRVPTFSINIGEIYIPYYKFIAMIGAVATALIMYFLLMYTNIGRKIRAVAQDSETASILGINIHRVYAITFALGSSLVGVAGGLLIPIYYVYPTVGEPFGLMAWIIIVLGGLGSFIGALVGGFIIGLVESISATLFSMEIARVIAFSIFILILVVKPEGLFGEKARV